MTALAKTDEAREIAAPETSESAAIIQLIERAASNPNVDIDKMERILQMRREMQADHARTAYMAALAEMQTELPTIQERGEIKIGSGKPQRYALWEDINEAIKPVLARHGFALSFRTGHSDGKISVTGILSHRIGHREETTMLLPLDTSGSKNNVQAVGSSTSYGKRYTAAALLNLTSRGEDDDGRTVGVTDTITEEQAMVLRDLMESMNYSGEKLYTRFKIASVSELPAADYAAVLATLKEIAAKRKGGA